MHRTAFRLAGLLALAALQFAPGGVAAGQETWDESLRHLTATVDHPFLPLATVPAKTFRGEQRDPETGETIAIRIEQIVLSQAEWVAGAEVTNVAVDDYRNGELVRTTEYYVAQAPDGTVYSLGERVDGAGIERAMDPEGGWLTGEGTNQPGVVMPADPAVGDIFTRIRIRGDLAEQSTVVAVEERVATPAGTFAGCIVTESVSLTGRPLTRASYCSGVGLVREEFPGGQIELVEFTAAASVSGAVATARQPFAIDDGLAFLPAAAITLESSIAAARNATPGDIGEIDLEIADGGLIFVLDVGSNELCVDAETGAVLSVLAGEEQER